MDREVIMADEKKAKQNGVEVAVRAVQATRHYVAEKRYSKTGVGRIEARNRTNTKGCVRRAQATEAQDANERGTSQD